MTQMGTETPLRFSPGEFIINAHERPMGLAHSHTIFSRIALIEFKVEIVFSNHDPSEPGEEPVEIATLYDQPLNVAS